jgi:hypothetical protein
MRKYSSVAQDHTLLNIMMFDKVYIYVHRVFFHTKTAVEAHVWHAIHCSARCCCCTQQPLYTVHIESASAGTAAAALIHSITAAAPALTTPAWNLQTLS